MRMEGGGSEMEQEVEQEMRIMKDGIDRILRGELSDMRSEAKPWLVELVEVISAKLQQFYDRR